jgi:hypothetical protein
VPSSGSISPSDRALVAALAGWGGAETPALLLRLGHQRARVLADLGKASTLPDPVATLHIAHEAQLGANASDIHPTWFSRALKEESASIQRTVVSAAVEPLRSLLLQSLDLTTADLQTDRPINPEIAQFVLSLWTERLVGDGPSVEADLPAVTALVTLPPRRLARFVMLVGLAKLAMLAGSKQAGVDQSEHRQLARFQGMLPEPTDPRLLKLASNDWTSARQAGHHAVAILGLSSIGRMLGQADPYRVRWTLQHLPYQVAKRLRAYANGREASIDAVLTWESRFFDLGQARLADSERRGRKSS